MEDKAYLGKGIKFPLQINQATGRFVMAEKEERFTRPDFGSNILSYTFMDTSVTRINMMARELEETILEQEPRISEVDVSIDPQLDKGCLIINIVYTIAESNTQDNLVFPFYLYAQEEGEQDEE